MSSSVQGPSQADLSAAAWRGEAAGAAEAYVEEQAAEAARQRAIEEARGAAGGDGVDLPPTPSELAAQRFWEHDPNRPVAAGPTTSPSSGGAGGGQAASTPHELSSEAVVALLQNGFSVTPAGPGSYYITAPPEAVNVISQAPLEAPDSMTALPGAGASGSPVPVSVPSLPPPLPESIAPTEAAKPAEETRKPDESPAVVSGQGKAVDEILNKSPTLRKAWETADANGWKIKEGKPGSGSSANPNTTPPTIFIDTSQVAKGPRYAERMASLIAHEIGHAVTPFTATLDGKTKQEFVEKNVKKDLLHEGSAAFFNAKVRDEIMNANPPGPNIAIRGHYDPEYVEVYEDYKNGLSEEEAKAMMALAFAQEPQAIDPETGGYVSKEKVLAEHYSGEWDKAHKD